MLKVLLVAACVLLIAACVVLLYSVELIPPWPYQRSIYGDHPPGYIAISPGQSAEGSVTMNVTGSADIIGVSSELNGELLTATFHLRDLPEEAKYSQKPGHFNLDTNHWVVLVSIEGDPLTPMSHPDYMFQATYYDPRKEGLVLFRPFEPMVTAGLYKCGRYIAEHNGKEFTSYEFLSSDVEVTFSHEDGTLTLAAQIPGITDKSTIAFVSHELSSGSPDYLPRDAD